MKHESSTAGAEINAPVVSKLVIPPCDAGRTIRSWRRRMGLTQEELARALSVTFSTVSRWENGHVEPSPLAWREMAKFAADRSCALHGADPSDSSAPLEVEILRT